MIEIKSKKTVRGNNVKAFIFDGLNKNLKTIFLIGQIHGNEPEGEFILNALKEKIESRGIVFKSMIVLIPCFNPDGKDLNIRGNGNAVDLNRNYDTKYKPWNTEFTRANRCPGKFAESEIETKFLIELTEKYKPDLVITIHSPLKNVNYDGGSKAKKIAKKIADYVGYEVVETIENQKGYAGSMGTYFGYDLGVPTITIETEACVIDNYLENLKKAIIVNSGKILDRELRGILGDIKQILDWENLNILFYRRGLSEVQLETNKKLQECFLGFDVDINFDKIRKVFVDNGRLDKSRVDKILGGFVEVLRIILNYKIKKGV